MGISRGCFRPGRKDMKAIEWQFVHEVRGYEGIEWQSPGSSRKVPERRRQSAENRRKIAGRFPGRHRELAGKSPESR